MSSAYLRLVPPVKKEEMPEPIPEPIAISYSPAQRTRRAIIIAFALFLWNSRGYVFMVILAALWIYLVRSFWQSQLRKD